MLQEAAPGLGPAEGATSPGQRHPFALWRIQLQIGVLPLCFSDGVLLFSFPAQSRSMISFYLASRHVVETPACQISITAGRPLLEEGVETKLSVRLTDQKEVCSAVLPLGFKIGCRTREDLRQNEILETLHSNKMAPPDVSVNDQESTQNAHLRLIGEAQQKMQMTAEVLFSPTMRQMAANDLWTAGHCTSSSWQLENRNITTSNLCGHEICLHPSPPEGPMQAFNQLLARNGERFKTFAGVLAFGS